MNSMETSMVWIAASYLFATLYSCRLAMSSMSSVRISPTPGPGTVRLALLRTSIELFGVEWTNDKLFPIICSATIAIRPPERIAISAQNLRAYKANVDNRYSNVHLNVHLVESIIYREYAHASGPLTIYLRVPTRYSDAIQSLLMSIGYWGQANSLAQCIEVENAPPPLYECAMPLHSLNSRALVRQLITGLVTEFRDSEVTWDEIVTGKDQSRTAGIRPELYIWPMRVVAQGSSERLLVRYRI